MKKTYGHEVEISLSFIEEYDIEDKIPTIIMNLYMYPNTKDTDQIGLEIIFQADITNYIKIRIEFKQNLLKSYKVIWEFYTILFWPNVCTLSVSHGIISIEYKYVIRRGSRATEYKPTTFIYILNYNSRCSRTYENDGIESRSRPPHYFITSNYSTVYSP